MDAYFQHVNPFLPLLHRPSFEKSVATRSQFIDHSFGSTLLLVCALGSRYSEDPRVFIADAKTPHSAGWKWLEQVPLNRKSFVEKPTLHELQNHAVCHFPLTYRSAGVSSFLFSSALGPFLTIDGNAPRMLDPSFYGALYGPRSWSSPT